MQPKDVSLVAPLEVPLTQYLSLNSRLKRIIGNITVNMSQVLNDILSDSLEEVAVGHMEDATYQVRKNMLVWFYGDGSSSIATILTSSDTTPANDAILALTLSDGPYNRFIKGQRYTIWDDDAGSNWPATKTQIATTELVCVNIDDVNKSVDFENVDASTGATHAIGDHLVLKGTEGAAGLENALVPKGIEYMFNNTGAFYGVADRREYGELVSYVEGSESALVAPEPDLIARMVNRIAKAGYAPPTILISESALSTQYAFTEKAGYATYVVPGFMPSPNGGVGQPIFQHGTIVMPWLTSEFIRPGSLLGCAADTILKFAPTGQNTIRWWNARGSGAGLSGIFIPVQEGSATGVRQTELWQAPFETHCEFMCLAPKRSFRHIGLTTQED